MIDHTIRKRIIIISILLSLINIIGAIFQDYQPIRNIFILFACFNTLNTGYLYFIHKKLLKLDKKKVTVEDLYPKQ